MPTTTLPPGAEAYQAKDYKSELKPIWCPGCGDFGVVQAIYRALAAIGRPPHEIAFISGIGCSSRIPGYTTAYGFNTVHGRALPIAQGIKLANPQLLVLAAGPRAVFPSWAVSPSALPRNNRRRPASNALEVPNEVCPFPPGRPPGLLPRRPRRPVPR
jgi:hypothetical protein